MKVSRRNAGLIAAAIILVFLISLPRSPTRGWIWLATFELLGIGSLMGATLDGSERNVVGGLFLMVCGPLIALRQIWPATPDWIDSLILAGVLATAAWNVRNHAGRV